MFGILVVFQALIVVVVNAGASTLVPTYYIDPVISKILVDSRQHCLRYFNGSAGSAALAELSQLAKESATEYFRSHELLAHAFFVESEQRNPHRRNSYSEAEFEYIPLLPLYWISNNQNCGYRSMIDSILQVQAYVVDRDTKYQVSNPLEGIRPKFSVASTFNLRTVLGTGMPTQVRRGAAWESVSAFVMSLSIGHYERWPQCPDLLRKSFKYVVELPYVVTPPQDIVSTSNNVRNNGDISKSKGLSGGAAVGVSTDTSIDAMTAPRKYMFHFSGNFALFGPEMICSVRNAVINVSGRKDVLVVNTTISDANSAYDAHLGRTYAGDSVFCLVTKSDSYSTSFFYTALRHGCIPVVISDWFTFSFPWLIPYEKFTLRVTEEDFLLNPDIVLDFVRDTIGGNVGLIASMRREMARYVGLLSHSPVVHNSGLYHSLLQHDVYYNRTYQSTQQSRTAGAQQGATATNSVTSRNSSAFHTYIPLELMLLELRYNQQPHQHYNNVPCLRPHMCARDHLKNTSYIPTPVEYSFPAKSKLRSVPRKYTEMTLINGVQSAVEKTGYEVANDGYQVKAVYLPAYEDVRTHLCRHSNRLIGSYKIVYYMQCVRILWPLHPGTFRPVDNIQKFNKTQLDAAGVFNKPQPADNKVGVIARYKGGRYSVDPEGITYADMEFVSTFHNITKPAGWVLTNRPVVQDKSRIVQPKLMTGA